MDIKKLNNSSIAVLYKIYTKIAEKLGPEKMDIEDIMFLVKLENEITRRFINKYLYKDEEE